MSQTKAPTHSYKNPIIYYTLGSNANYNRSSRLCLDSCIESDLNLVPTSFNNLFQENNRKFLEILVLNFNINNFPFFEFNNFPFSEFNDLSETNNTVQPNFEKPGGPNPPTNKKIILSSFEYDLLNKHVKCSDLQMGGCAPGFEWHGL